MNSMFKHVHCLMITFFSRYVQEPTGFVLDLFINMPVGLILRFFVSHYAMTWANVTHLLRLVSKVLFL